MATPGMRVRLAAVDDSYTHRPLCQRGQQEEVPVASREGGDIRVVSRLVSQGVVRCTDFPGHLAGQFPTSLAAPGAYYTTSG